MCLSEKLREASSGYGNRSFGKEADEELRVLYRKSQDKAGRAERAGVWDPKYSGKNRLPLPEILWDLRFYLMKWNKGRKDCTVEIEEI